MAERRILVCVSERSDETATAWAAAAAALFEPRDALTLVHAVRKHNLELVREKADG